MTVGKKIRLIRKFRGFTQSELGKKIGLPGDRIRQYENNIRTPREDVVADLAEALDVDPHYLVDHVIDKDIDIIHVLFELEDIHKIDLQKNENGYTLFIPASNNPTAHSLPTYLDYWYNMRQEVAPKISDTKKEIDSKLSNYRNWKSQFPTNTFTAAYEEYKKIINEIQCKIMMNCIVIRDSDIPMKYSGFIELIKNMLEAKIDMIFEGVNDEIGLNLLISIDSSQFDSFTTDQLHLLAKFLHLMEWFEDVDDCFCSSHSYREKKYIDFCIRESTLYDCVEPLKNLQNAITNNTFAENEVNKYTQLLEKNNREYFHITFSNEFHK